MRSNLVSLFVSSIFAAATVMLVAANVRAACGDGVVDGGEQCDDGNLLPSDCCSPDCQYDQAGTPCEFGDVCAEFLGSECDGEGVCEIVLDGCGPFGSYSDDRFRGKLVDEDPSTGDLLKLAYKRLSPGSSPTEWFGDPSSGTRYAICVTDRYASLLEDGAWGWRGTRVLHSLELPTGEGWSKKSTGYVYRSGRDAADPFQRVKLWAKPSALAGELRTKVQVKAKGPGLMLPPPATPTHYFEPDFLTFSGAPAVCVANELGHGTASPDVISAQIEPRRVTWKRFRSRD